MFCLDTNIVIVVLNERRPALARRLDREIDRGTALMIPAIVRFELEYGYAKSVDPARNRERLRHFLSVGFEQPAFDKDDALEAGTIRAALEAKGTPIGPYDVLIAAQARRRGAALVTLNRREFERVPGLIVTDWAT
jgi:tRNA(fMet)-specific endonuclease VapC